jgi:hypothetical protein
MRRTRLLFAGVPAVSMVAASLALLACSSSSSGGAAGGGDAGNGGDAGGDGTGAACVDTLPDGGPVQVTGTVVTALEDGATVPVPNAMVATEYGGLYLPWCDLSKASPYYRFGAVTDDAGAFTMTAAAGKLGFHGFATGQYYSRAPLDTSKGTTVTVILAPLPAGQPKPTITGAAFDQSTVTAGAQVTLSATVMAGSPTDPLSDETVLVEPTHSWGVELDPPSLGKKDDFPDGVWSLTFSAPAQSGSYTYWLSATSAGCATSDVVELPLIVQ